MGDDKIQREGGDAIWNSISHALRPGLKKYVSIKIELNHYRSHELQLTYVHLQIGWNNTDWRVNSIGSASVKSVLNRNIKF